MNLPDNFNASMLRQLGINLSPEMTEEISALMKMRDSLAPRLSVWWSEMPKEALAFEIIIFIVTFLVGLMTAKMLRDVILRVEDESYQADVCILILAPFFICVFSMLSNVFVRAAGVLYAIALTYVVLCLYRIVILLCKVFGGTKEFSKWLVLNQRRITFANPPLCCCFRCIPSAEPTERNILLLRIFVLQTPIIRITIQIVVIIMLLEGVSISSTAALVLNVIAVISTLIGVYVTQTVFKLTQEFLAEFGMIALFRSVDLCQALVTILKFVFDILGRKDVFHPYGSASSKVVATFWYNVAMSLCCLLLTLLLFVRIRPGKCALFDSKFIKNTIAQKYASFSDSRQQSAV